LFSSVPSDKFWNNIFNEAIGTSSRIPSNRRFPLNDITTSAVETSLLKKILLLCAVCRRTENKLGGGVVGNSRPAGRYGDYNCDSPWPLVESAAKAMRSKHGDNIEFVLWTG
jgi:hypothetical protein